jgi:hypothetical protein
MDDPWGSPWADESPYPLPKLDKLVSKRPVTSAKASGVDQDSKSPWNDDDGYGEWATLPATDEVQANEQDGPEQAEIVEWNAPVSKEFTQGQDHIRPDGSAWFTRQIQPTEGGRLGLEIPQVSGRALSPDPWAQETAGAEEEAQYHDVAESNSGEESRTCDTNGDGAQTGLAIVKNEDEHGTQATEFERGPRPNGDGELSVEHSSISHDQDEPTASLDNTATHTETGEVTQGELLTSRPSSSPSDRSRHDEVLTESPRTSFEEEDKRPKLERGGTSKVKEMVRLFDGLAGDEVSTELPGHPGHIDSNDGRSDTPVAARSEDDFGDFEEGISNVTSKTGSTKAVEIEQEVKPQDTADNRRRSDIPAGTEAPTMNPSDQPLEPHSPVQFEPNLLQLSSLFGQTSDTEYVHADPQQAPEDDTVVADSFSSTSERKTWYRMSRFGTMRKHNAGDEDSYVRINWKDSTVRTETLKVVERWIDEDRLGGGVILGGGTRLGSMFGWGQKNAAPISVAAALASRSGKIGMHPDHNASPTSARNSDASPIHMTDSSRKSSEQISASNNSFQSPASTTAPQFSWSTGTPRSATTKATLPVLPPLMPPNSNLHDSSSARKAIKESSSRNIPASKGPSATSNLVSTQRTKPADNVPRLEKHPVILQVAEYPANGPHLEAEDDWGEMISSPALEDPPPIQEAFKNQTNSSTMKVLSPSLGISSPVMSSEYISKRRSSDRVTAQQSGESMFIAPNVENHTATPEITSSTAPRSDAWATADFSFFDSPVPSKPTPALPAMFPKASIPTPVPIIQSQGPSKHQAVQAVQSEQERIVKSIVQNLPDLSYMLRR